jgi:hypothetical protein
MKRSNFDHAYKLTVSVRTESGSVSVDLGLQGLTRQERKSLFILMKDTSEGGSVGFGVEPGPNGESIIKLGLSGKPAKTEEPAVLNGTSA